MNLLIDEAPVDVNIAGRVYPIYWSFRNSILFEQLMLNPSIPDQEKGITALHLYYPAVPAEIESAFEQLLWFYRAERPPRRVSGGRRSARKIFDYDQDAGYIFAAFWHDYQIDLNEVDLHWWKFRAMFEALHPDNMICKIMEWRGADTSKLRGEQKKFVVAMQRLYALQMPAEEQTKIEIIENAILQGKPLIYKGG